MGEPIGIDSNALTYLVEATEATYDPATDDPALAAERVAMFRIFLYVDRVFWVPPAVRNEFGRIRNPYRFTRHDSVTGTLLLDHDSGADETAIAARAVTLERSHAKEQDCRILAEVEFMGLDTLLTFDGHFIRNVTGHTSVSVIRPSDFWGSLGIPVGAVPVWEPARSNPLSAVAWWRV